MLPPVADAWSVPTPQILVRARCFVCILQSRFPASQISLNATIAVLSLPENDASLVSDQLEYQ